MFCCHELNRKYIFCLLFKGFEGLSLKSNTRQQIDSFEESYFSQFKEVHIFISTLLSCCEQKMYFTGKKKTSWNRISRFCVFRIVLKTQIHLAFFEGRKSIFQGVEHSRHLLGKLKTKFKLKKTELNYEFCSNLDS